GPEQVRFGEERGAFHLAGLEAETAPERQGLRVLLHAGLIHELGTQAQIDDGFRLVRSAPCLRQPLRLSANRCEKQGERGKRSHATLAAEPCSCSWRNVMSASR